MKVAIFHAYLFRAFICLLDLGIVRLHLLGQGIISRTNRTNFGRTRGRGGTTMTTIARRRGRTSVTTFAWTISRARTNRTTFARTRCRAETNRTTFSKTRVLLKLEQD